MSNGFRAAVAAAAVLAWAAPAVAQEAAAAAEVCTPAQVPTLAKPVKPKDPPLPKCVNEKTRTHTCRKGEIGVYNAEVERVQKKYNTEFDAYFEALQQYSKDANAYVKCELKSLDVILTQG